MTLLDLDLDLEAVINPFGDQDVADRPTPWLLLLLVALAWVCVAALVLP